MPYLPQLLEYFASRYPHAVPGVEEAQATDPERFARLTEKLLTWAVKAHGDQIVPQMADAFVEFTHDIIRAQIEYEAAGRYKYQSFDEVNQAVYSQNETMRDYLWGSYLSNVLWAHHIEIGAFFEDRFLCRVPQGASIVDIAPGHGTWGIWTLERVPHAELNGFDVSPAAVELAGQLAQAAGVGDRAEFSLRDALQTEQLPAESADACISSFLAEHLEDPNRLFAGVRHLLKPSGIGLVTAALTAAQVDHLYEFRRESELVTMCEQNGLRVLETICTSPRRTLPKARFLPRSMALLVTRRQGELW